MIKIKKTLALLLVTVFCFSLVACSSSNGSSSGNANIEGSLEEIMNKIIDKVEVDDETKEYVLGRLSFTQVAADSDEYYLGKTGFSYKEAYAAEPMVNAQAFSLVLVRANSADEAETLKDEIKSSVNPNKWICVGVDESDVKTANIGDLVFLVMAENSQAYIDAFNSIA